MPAETVMRTILIIDDNIATRYAMRRVLERQAWRVLEAGMGADGLALLASNDVDVLVLDVNLPDMSGFDVVHTLRAADRTRLLPIVHVSAASIHTRDMITGLEGGADSYLIHPVDPGVLIATLRTLLRVREAEEALRALRERQQAEHLHTAHSQLAEAISAREATEIQLVQAQKMDALGQLTGGIAHDFNNLLTSIITSLGLLSEEVLHGRTEAAHQYAGTAMAAARRAASLTHRLLAFARQQPLDTRAVDINARIASLEELLKRTIGERIQLRIDLEPIAAVAQVDANQFENAILNLVVNARDALPEGGTIRIGTRAPNDAPGFVEMFVEDDGTGMSEDVLEKVFEPFFTTKPIGQGTGLGLSMTYGFARQSGGEARIASSLGVGTTVSILLPMGDAARLAPAHAIQAPGGIDAAGRGERILLVEDDDSVRELTATLLSMAGYDCVPVPDVYRALAILRSDERIDLLLTDVGLPGMDGRALADAARIARPTLQVLFLTGYARHSLALGDFLGQGMDMMAKPYDADALLGRVAQLVRAARATA